jgi:signal peptide peptidase-like protein 2B
VVTPENAHGLQQVFNSTDKIKVRLYGGGGVDASTAVLGIIAVLCIVIGSYSGPYGSIPGRARQEQRILDGSAVPTAARPSEVPITITTILVLVIFITVTLLSLYFFYEYLVYVFILIFCIASTRATYCIFIQLLCCCDFGMTPPKIRNYGLHEILLAVFCLSITIVWFIFRSSNFSWILQDFLGICFCIHVIQTLRLPNLKICAVLLGMLFVYDIFFVFITPLFMKNGKSIMVEVATGGGGNSTEQIPVLLKVPRLQGGPAADCNPGQYSLLGFGDIIIPGLLVCFAHTFDIMNALKFRPYFIVTSLGYTIGLFGAFIALYLMRTGQPALLYIVPAILVAIFSLGTCRKEVKALWRGTTTEMNMVADAGA